MEKKFKQVPFDLELAKKIQVGEIEGTIKTREGTVICEFFSFSKVAVGSYGIYATIDGLVHSYSYDGYERKWDRSGYWKGDLVLEVPDNEPQFKPFDKVLVRNEEGKIWYPSIFSHKLGDSYYTVCSYPYEVGNIIPYEGNERLLGTTNNPE